MSHIKKYCFLFIYVLLPLPFLGFYLGGALTFIPIVILFGLVPICDAFVIDSSNPTVEEEKSLKKQSFFRYVTYAYVPVQAVMIITSIYLITHYALSPLEFVGFMMSVALISGGCGINLAHEMMHKNSKLQQVLSKTLLCMTSYGVFFVEHVRGHHINVATPHDPATAKFGQSFYQFLPQTLFGSWRSAFKLEKKRMKQKGRPACHKSNAFWWIIGGPLAITMACYSYGGLLAAVFFLGQSIIAICELELVNYIEHYGLLRKKLDNGRYERVQPHHSWNANHWFSNMILFHLQRHSDHHTYGAKPYQILRHVESSPQLPSGYLGMMMLALVPPLWRKVMDPKVAAFYEKKSCEETGHLKLDTA